MREAQLGDHACFAVAEVVQRSRKVVLGSAKLNSGAHADDFFNQDGPHEFIGMIVDEVGRPRPGRARVNITSMDAVAGTVFFQSTGPVEFLD